MKALFLGLGGVGQRHLRNLKALQPDAEIAAVRHGRRTFEITPALAADRSVDIEEKYAIRTFPTITAAVESFSPDLAVVATPSSLHGAQAAELAAAGVPVLLEKPLAHDEDAMDLLVGAANQSGTPVMIGYMLRFHPGVLKLRELIAAGAVGRLNSGHVVANTYMPDWHPYETPSDYYVGRQALGGGTILTNIHLIDLLVWIMGPPARLWCQGGKLSDLDIDVEDTISALFQFDGGVAVTLNMSFVQRPPLNVMTFRGTEGEISWNLAEAGVTLCRPDGRRETVAAEPVEWNDLFVAEMRAFIDAIEAGRAPSPALAEVLDGQRAAFALKRSLAEGGLVAP